jgi:DNA-binding LytR/AlgR family response regulator
MMTTTILIVDDQPQISKILNDVLTKKGYSTVMAFNGEAGYQKALEIKPNLIIMDIMMPVLSGFDSAKKIKSHTELANIPIIFLTAYADESTLAKAKVTEPHGYILKPFKEIDIHTSIEMAIHKHKKERELKVEAELLRSITRHKDNAEYLFVKHQSMLVKLEVEEVLFVEALKDYVIVHTSKENYTIHSTMKDIERKLPGRHFLRVHRSYIINTDKIKAIGANGLLMDDTDKEIPIGGSYKDALGDRINLL